MDRVLGNSHLGPRPSAKLAIGLFLGTRVLQLFVAWLVDPEIFHVLANKGDAGWYQRLAAEGYELPLPKDWRNPDSDAPLPGIALFPLYPSLIRVTGSLSIPLPIAGLVVSWLASIAAAWGLFRLGELLSTAKTGVILTVLWGCLPGSVVLSMGLSEPLFAALAVWSLVLLLQARLIPAAILSLLAGLTRPTGIAVAAAVLWVALPIAFRGPQRWRALTAATVSLSGLAIYLAFVSWQTKSPFGWLEVQARWNSYSDWGSTLFHTLRQHWITPSLPFTVVAWSVLIAIALLAWLVWIRPPAPITVYSVVVLIPILIQANYAHSRLRFLVLAFTLLLPPAIALARTKPWLGFVVLSTAAVLSSLFGAWLLTAWPWSI